MNTPWGIAQSHVSPLTGLGEVSTPGHGGMYVSPATATQLKLTPACLEAGFFEAGFFWFEEDCDAAV